MEKLPLILLIFCLFSLASTIIINGGRFGGGSSSSSEESGRGYYGGRPRPHRPRPHRPHPPHRPRPPRPNDPEPVCENGWMSFHRPQGLWCVKVFYAVVTQYTAVSLCQNHGAVLSGVQDANERYQIANAGRILANQNGGGTSEVWLGAKRMAHCTSKAACPPMATFQWTDGHTTGTGGFFWPGIEPSFHWQVGYGSQDCLEMHVSVRDGVAGQYGYPHGSLDDEHCGKVERMYACGKLPS